MTPAEFVVALEKYFQADLPMDQSERMVRFCARYSNAQLDRMYDYATEECEHFWARGANPVKQVKRVAAELGFSTAIESDRPASKLEEYIRTECRFCGGYGLVLRFQERVPRQDGTWRMTFVSPPMAVNDGAAILDWKTRHGDESCYEVIGRCNCPAGSRKGLPAVPVMSMGDWIKTDKPAVQPAQLRLVKPEPEPPAIPDDEEIPF